MLGVTANVGAGLNMCNEAAGAPERLGGAKAVALGKAPSGRARGECHGLRGWQRAAGGKMRRLSTMRSSPAV